MPNKSSRYGHDEKVRFFYLKIFEESFHSIFFKTFKYYGENYLTFSRTCKIIFHIARTRANKVFSKYMEESNRRACRCLLDTIERQLIPFNTPTMIHYREYKAETTKTDKAIVESGLVFFFNLWNISKELLGRFL